MMAGTTLALNVPFGDHDTAGQNTTLETEVAEGGSPPCGATSFHLYNKQRSSTRSRRLGPSPALLGAATTRPDTEPTTLIGVAHREHRELSVPHSLMFLTKTGSISSMMVMTVLKSTFLSMGLSCCGATCITRSRCFIFKFYSRHISNVTGIKKRLLSPGGEPKKHPDGG